MPPKRKVQRRTRSQQSPVVVVSETDQQATLDSFDVASIPMNEDGTQITQQRQQEFRSPSASQRGGRTGAKRATAAPPAHKKSRREAGVNEENESGALSGGATSEARADDAAADGGSLAEHTLEALVATGAASAAADRLLQEYKSGAQATVICAVLNLVAKASGVQEVELDSNALADGVDISPLLEELYARVPADSAAYLLVNKDAKYRRFRRAFPDFSQWLIMRAWAADVLFDGILLPTLAQWLLSVSESKSRSFRHTATVMLLGFLKGFNEVYKDLKNLLTVSTTKKLTTATEKSMETLVLWRDHFFSQAVHQRLRDVAPEIRLCVFQALKGWILDYREEYMTNKYLRYFGMPLHDKRPELRAEALDMIWQALYTIPDAYSRMHLFLQYFSARLVEMSNDVEVRCAELAIRIVALIVREDSEVAEGNELLKNPMIDQVLLNLFDERPTIRTAAGILLKVFIHCRTAGEETEEEQVKVATELLCSFASTLRSLYEEKMPEKYLIDALWTPERLPLLLTEYKPMLDAAQTAEVPMDAIVGLGLLTALLNKMQGKLTLGPLPKDDRRGTAAAARKVPRDTQETVNELAQAISKDLGFVLGVILENFGGDEQVLRAVANAVAAVDLSVFTSGEPSKHLEHLMLVLRKATLSAPCATATRDALVAAWHALAFTEYPLKGSAQAHLAFMHKQVLQQVAKATDDALKAWGRLSLISALVPTTEQWPVLQAALARQLDRANAAGGRHAAPDNEEAEAESDQAAAREFVLLEWMAGTAVNGALWRVSALKNVESLAASGGDDGQATNADAAEVAVRVNIASVIAVLLQCLRAGDSILRSGATSAQEGTVAAIVSLRSAAATHLCDLAVLRFYDMPLVEQESLLDAFDSLFEYWSAQLRAAQDGVKTAVSQHQENSVLSQVAAARQLSSHMEASQMRLAIGVARLLVLKRMDVALAPRVLVQWTQTSSKAVSDTFKSLFHTLRDRAGDSFHLERDILLTAYSRCAEVGATPVSVDALYQTGTKLASMHFTATDRYYPAVVAMVQFAAEFAASTDPLLLQGVVPYCNKLRAPDALRLVRQDLAAQDIFMNPANLYVRAFITAMRKAAKLEEFLSTSSAAVLRAREPSSATGAGGKRPRELLNGVHEQEREDHLLAEIARSVTEDGASVTAAGRSSSSGAAHATSRSAGAKAAKGTTAGRMSVTERVVTEDGWRELPTSQPVSVTLTPQDLVAHGGEGARRKAGVRAAVEMPTSQEMAMSSLADGINTEAFIATEEFD